MSYLAHPNQHVILFCKVEDPLTSFDWRPDHNGESEQGVLKRRMKKSWDLMSLLSQFLIMKSQIVKADPLNNMHPLKFSHFFILALQLSM